MVTDMVIRSKTGTYKVIRTLECSQAVHASLCSRKAIPPTGTAKMSAQEKFLVMSLDGPGLSRKMLVYFMELSMRRETSDFIECFIREENIWVVFRYYEEALFEDSIGQDYSLEERLALGRSLITKLLSQKLPVYLQYEVLNPLNIMLGKSMEVHFNYLLYEPQAFEKAGFDMVESRLNYYFEKLFEWELKEERSNRLSGFIADMRCSSFSDEKEVYRAWRELEEILLSEQEKGSLAPKGFFIRQWKRLIKCSGRIFKFLYLLLLAALAGVLVYVCMMPETAPKERLQFQSIGTLEIRKQIIPCAGEMETEEQQEPGTEKEIQPETEETDTQEKDVKEQPKGSQPETGQTEDSGPEGENGRAEMG